jgi:hypothetical protein
MKFDNSKMKISMLGVLILIIGSLSLYSYVNRGTTTQSGETYHFIKPVFAQSMSTAPTFLDEEAGISLYVNINRSIDLSVARPVYRTMEKETADYIVGSVGLPGLSSDEDVHCFVHKDGWIVTYYLKGEPLSKIVDWNLWSQSASKLTKNKLQAGLEQMTSAIAVSVSSVNYYHFHYPNATNCMIILKTVVGSGDRSFNVTIPDDIKVSERSWSHYAQSTWYTYEGTYHTYFKINGNTINSISGITNPVTDYGTLTFTNLTQGTPNVVGVSSDARSSYLYGVCIGLVYQEP